MIFLIIGSIMVSIYAILMGYSGILWFLVSILCTPLAPLYLLASLPDKNLEKRRKQERCLLQKQLAQRTYIPEDSASVLPRRTISDDTTIN